MIELYGLATGVSLLATMHCVVNDGQPLLSINQEPDPPIRSVKRRQRRGVLTQKIPSACAGIPKKNGSDRNVVVHAVQESSRSGSVPNELPLKFR
jgi:hypothetical protein